MTSTEVNSLLVTPRNYCPILMNKPDLEPDCDSHCAWRTEKGCAIKLLAESSPNLHKLVDKFFSSIDIIEINVGFKEAVK